MNVYNVAQIGSSRPSPSRLHPVCSCLSSTVIEGHDLAPSPHLSFTPFPSNTLPRIRSIRATRVADVLAEPRWIT